VVEEKWAQMERLEALEHTDLPSSIATVTPTIPTSNPAVCSRSLYIGSV